MEVSPRDVMYRLPVDDVLVNPDAAPQLLAQTDLRWALFPASIHAEQL